jgi:hypothetical protein
MAGDMAASATSARWTAPGPLRTRRTSGNAACEDFYKPIVRRRQAWKTIQVPGMMQAQGYGKPIFTNIKYPFPANEPFIPHETERSGLLPARLRPSRNWNGRDVFLHIGAAGAAYYVWVNGQKVGYSEDSKLPSEFDVTRYLRPGKQHGRDRGLSLGRRFLSGRPGFLARVRHRAQRVSLCRAEDALRDYHA